MPSQNMRHRLPDLHSSAWFSIGKSVSNFIAGHITKSALHAVDSNPWYRVQPILVLLIGNFDEFCLQQFGNIHVIADSHPNMNQACSATISLSFQDVSDHSRLCDQLLGHYTEAWRDRQVYYQARQRAKCQNDLLVMILDSFDKCKMVLPRWKYGRVPKRSLYENTHRNHGWPSM